MNKFTPVRCRHKTKNIVKMMPFHITEKAFFKQDWVVEDTGAQEEKILQDPNDLTALRVKVVAMGMKNTNKATKNDMIAFMNEPKKIEVIEKLPSIEDPKKVKAKKVVKKVTKKPKKSVKKTIKKNK